MKRILVVLAAAVFAVALATSTGAQEQPQPVPPEASPAPAPHVVSRRFIIPKRVIHRSVHFVPSATPAAGTVIDLIIPVEAARFGASAAHLHNRVACESGFKWWITNGQYHGLGQFALSTMNRGISTLGKRSVRYTSSRVRARRVFRIDTYSDGSVKKVKRWRRHQTVVTVHRGRLPRWPNWTHGWAQIRIMAQAMVGRSAVHDSEWSCR